MAGGVDEVESKHPVPDPAALGARLAALGFEPGPVREQLDEYYDTPGGGLRGQDLVARLRVVAGAATAGFKGPRTHAEDGTYRRIEVEFPADAATVRAAFAAQGLTLVWRLAKRRREFRRDGLVVAVDELPLLGAYAEFEGPPAQIAAARDQVAGLVGRPEPRNYAELAKARLGDPDARELLF
ncbi:CYTH domain-containing protein [Dactylosporangium sp. NPDC005555]|uniref:CYTH domain-containing protein n=1 Tax=Dactylosporangium sp. NPDC005555 TaxID=3154889 RepID=UPI0033A02310